jgi:hypothetical protein
MPLRYAESCRIANEGAEVDKMTEQPLDLWTGRRGEVAVLVDKLSPSEALEVLSRVVADATDSTMLAPVLIGCIRRVVERGGTASENETSASEDAYRDMKTSSPDLGDK